VTHAHLRDAGVETTAEVETEVETKNSGKTQDYFQPLAEF
jgi:hypothetical protein